MKTPTTFAQRFSTFKRLPDGRIEFPNGMFHPAVITSLAKAQQLLDKAIELIPNLTKYGIGLDFHTLREIGRNPDLIRQRIAESQADLGDGRHLEEIVACADWCHFQKVRQTINHQHSSYGYKHMVENWRGLYISNGSFIAAAVGLGFRHVTKGWPDIDLHNPFFNLREPKPEYQPQSRFC
jgi:hypothetical protein